MSAFAEHGIALVVMARAPELGRVKTRLAAAIGDAQAVAMYRQMLAITARAAAAWRGPVLLTTVGNATTFAGTGLEHCAQLPQPAGPLALRLAAALQAGLERAQRCIVIGSDCPALTVAALHRIAMLLDATPVAFGPAMDGGFWAIGASDVRVAEAVTAAAVPWSTDRTLAILRDELLGRGIASATGPMLADCDEPADLQAAIAAGHLRAAAALRCDDV